MAETILGLSTKSAIELVAILMLPFGLLLIVLQRLASGAIFGARLVQMTAAVMLIPVILILALEQILDRSVVATIIGALVGFLLSGAAGAAERERPDLRDERR
jgi:hypothetical protein